MEKTYTVFVGGVEVNDYLLSKKEADMLKEEYLAAGYNDIVVFEIV